MHVGKNKRRSEAGLAWRRRTERHARSRQGLQAATQIGKHLVRHAGADAAGVDELTVVGTIAEQERAEMRPRSFRVSPADDNELLTIEAFGFAPEAPVSRRIGRVDGLRNDAFEPKPAGMFADKLAIARLVVVELEAGNIPDQGFQKRFALDERQASGVAAVKMEKIETSRIPREPSVAACVCEKLGNPSSPMPHNSPSR
jgi:hypothetical protein